MVNANLSPNGLSRFSRIILFGWFLIGTAYLLSAVTPFDASPTLRSEPVSEIALGLLFFFGASAAITSAFDWTKESTSWALELFGWPLLAAAWGLFTLLTVLHGAWAGVLLLSITCFCASIWRFTEVLKQAADTRKNVERYKDVLPRSNP